MVGWHHQLNGCEFEQAPGDGEGQGSLVCCGPWGRTESDMTEVTEQQQQRLFLSSGQVLPPTLSGRSESTSVSEGVSLTYL